MNTKNYLTHTKKYKVLISAIHSVYRLINSTYELKELICRMGRLSSQIFHAHYCLIILLDPSKKYSAFKCLIIGRKKIVVDKKFKISKGVERKILKTVSSVRKGNIMGLPLVCEDIMGLIIVKRPKDEMPFDSFDQEVLSTMSEQAIIGIKNLQLYEEQQRIVLGSIKSLVTMLYRHHARGWHI